MPKKLLFIVSLLCALSATVGCKVVRAQGPPTAGYVVYQSYTPAGSCAYPNYLTVVNTSTTAGGGVYQCTGTPLTWQKVGTANGVQSIDTLTGNFSFTGPGVSHIGNTYTFSGTGTGIGSIAWALPSWLAASPTTLSSSGTQTFQSATGQTSHLVLGTCGTATSVGLCALTAGDLPALPYLPSGTQLPVTRTQLAHQFIANYDSVSGLFGTAQPSFADITGTLAAAQIPTPTVGALGGVQASTSVANEFLDYIGTDGAPHARSIVAADVPVLNQNTTGTAANLSGTPALPNGTTATTQTLGDNTTKLATTAFALANRYITALTTTGTSGPATVSSGTLNIPQYSGGTMTWPAAAGIANYAGSNAWGLSYSASNQIPASFIATLNQNTTGTAANLSGTPALPNGTTATTQANGDNSTKLATTAFVIANGSGYTLPQATTSVLGGVKCDGTTITCTSGVITAVSGGSGNTTSTSLTTNVLPRANGPNSIINSALSDDGTTVTSAEPVVVASIGTNGLTPGAVKLTAGAGSIAALPANSAGLAAPATGGTAYLLKLPATITAGIIHAAAPATADGVNESAVTSSAVNLATADVTGNLGVSHLNSGTSASASTFWRGDGTWAGAGTVTSVAVTGANGIGVSGSPVTSNGTIALTLGAITPTSIATSGSTQGVAALGVGTGTIATGSLPANYVGFAGPASGTPAYFLQLPAANPAGQVMKFATPSTVNGISQSVGTYISTTRSLGWSFGDVATGSALTTSEVGYITVPFACTITGWHIMADSGTVTVKTARVNGGTALPTVASNSISTSGVSLATGTKIDSTTLTDFTSTSIAANDTLGFFITAVSGAKQVTFSLDCAQ